MPNSLQSSAIASPASRRATNCSLSSITEHSFQGITPSPSTGRKCHLCVRYNVLPMSQVAHFESMHFIQSERLIHFGYNWVQLQFVALESDLEGQIQALRFLHKPCETLRPPSLWNNRQSRSCLRVQSRSESNLREYGFSGDASREAYGRSENRMSPSPSL